MSDASPFDQWPTFRGPEGEIMGGGPDGPPPFADAPPAEEEPADESAAFVGWVQEQLARVEAYGVRGSDRVPWCPQWWEHPEVVERLYVAWRAYVHALSLKKDGDGMALSGWWLQHWDRHAAVIFDGTQGPFRRCDRNAHWSKGEPTSPDVVVATPPAEWAL